MKTRPAEFLFLPIVLAPSASSVARSGFERAQANGAGIAAYQVIPAADAWCRLNGSATPIVGVPGDMRGIARLTRSDIRPELRHLLRPRRKAVDRRAGGGRTTTSASRRSY